MYSNIAQLLSNDEWLLNVNDKLFDDIALSIFEYQYQHCNIYRQFADITGKTPKKIDTLNDIPFLPISFFKSHEVVSSVFKPELVFESSGTTSTVNSKHFVKNALLYQNCYLQGWQQFYHAPEEYAFLCLLPSYLERNNSSLVYMAKGLIEKSGRKESGFYLHEWDALANNLLKLKTAGKKVVLLGVTFALLDFAEAYPMDLSGIIVMETGGMKGRKEEWTRKQVHDFLKKQWQLPAVHAEYGMTELLSQAYATQDGFFRSINTMKALVREENDPFDVKDQGSGCLNIVDLANIHSCSFIATDDIARIHQDNSFEVLGRLDNSALRGCSLMVL